MNKEQQWAAWYLQTVKPRKPVIGVVQPQKVELRSGRQHREASLTAEHRYRQHVLEQQRERLRLDVVRWWKPLGQALAAVGEAAAADARRAKERQRFRGAVVSLGDKLKQAGVVR